MSDRYWCALIAVCGWGTVWKNKEPNKSVHLVNQMEEEGEGQWKVKQEKGAAPSQVCLRINDH